MLFVGCTVVSLEIPKNSISYELHKSSDFDYSGKLTVNELPDGLLEFEIQPQGTKGNADTEYLTHLHFGSYDSPNAPIAMVLEPVNSSNLKSTTVLNELSDGTKLSFEGLGNFLGHAKVHLDKEGPDYKVILAAGNIGSSAISEKPFNANDITMCNSELP